MEENVCSTKQLTVGELIELLKNFNLDLPVWITTSDDPERCYQKMDVSDLEKGDIWHPEVDTDDGGPAETPGVIIASKRFFP